MFDYSLAFLSPWWLLLLLLLPVLWWVSLLTLSGLGRTRRWAAIAFRTVVMLAVILSLAEIQIKRTSDRLTVIYLLDQSMSIPESQRLVMVDYVNKAIAEHRQNDREDRAGVIVFGRDAAIEHPPFDDDIVVSAAIESRIETDHTNLAGAIKLAQATLPEDSAGRIVIICDGNENLGDAREQARRLAEAGVGIDVVPVRYEPRGEVAVEKVAIPSDVNRGQPFDLRVVLNNTAQRGEKNGAVKGKLKVVRKTRDREEVLQEDNVSIEPGKKVYTLREEIDSPDFYTYEAVFTPDDRSQDALAENNAGTAFTNVRGRGQILLIEDQDDRGQFEVLVDRLRRQNLQVSIRPTNEPIGSLAELQPFDTVILGNVPREAFTDAQISMLVSNTRNMGAGLIMLGGENSFGAGGWANTELEQAMPVDFQIKNAKVAPVGALVMVMHACEIPQGNFWQAEIAKAAIKALGNQDYCGLIQWNGTDRWLWRPGLAKVGENRKLMLAAIDRMTPGDMPQFDPGLSLAVQGFKSVPDAAVKHMIVISDGDPGAPTKPVLDALVKEKIKVSTVAIGTHGPPTQTPLRTLQSMTGGKFYVPKSPKQLPQIFQKEARAVSRPLIYERERGFQPQLAYSHDILKGIDGPLPPITGFVMTTIKESPLVEVALLSPEPPTGAKYNTILATWTYGLGKTVAFTSDAGRRWSSPWTGWENYEKFFGQMVRWSMRPAGDQGKFTIASEIRDGKVEVVITALDKEDEFLNFLNMGGSAVGPDMKPIDLKIRQTAPGRYVSEFDARDAGSYFLMVSPGAGMSPLLTGVNVPYSAEYLDREPNDGLLKDLASLTPKGSEPGVVIEDKTGGGIDALLEFNPFRHNLQKATSRQDVWHWLLLAGACLFFADVFNRRVTIDLAWTRPYLTRALDKVFRREPVAVPSATMERLRSRKAAIAQQLDERRAAVRFEPAPDAPTDGAALDDAAGLSTARPKSEARPQQIAPQAEQPEDYTSRLLKAKKRVWDERKNDDNGK
ncbi:MAG: VWA domain-containing protein [Pirellulales bacterium]